MTYFPKRCRVVFLILILSACIPLAPTASAVQGAPGMGDPYFPNPGNGGYDVQSYTITLDVDPPGNNVTGSTTVTANATEFLSSFNLDIHGLTVDSVSVNDEKADFSRSGDELTVNPAAPLEANKSFTVLITYHGSPGRLTGHSGLPGLGWSHGVDGVINVWGEPDAASTWFPSNNHPRDKATYRFEITVPDPWMVAATGTLKETKEAGDRTTYIWEMAQPMATYLASINIDRYELVTQNGPNGVTIRNYFPADLPASHRLQFAALPAMIQFFEDFFGPYPFDEYGVVVAGKEGLCDEVGIALEAQTLSIHCPSDVMTSEFVVVHELAHMWFGDSVSLENWKDMWLKEGFATYATWLWKSKNDAAVLSSIAKDARNGFPDPYTSVAEPSPNNLYSGESYVGGALVLYALQQEVGEEAFFKTLKTFTASYQYGNAGTEEFIDTAEEASGKDLTAFFDAWLFSPTLPDLPE